MRMWLTDTKTMCKKHLLGEHVEIHMLVGSIKRNKNIDGFLNGLVDPQQVAQRHKEIVMEMYSRGFKHSSTLPEIETELRGEIDIVKNYRDLHSRCKDCMSLWLGK